MLVCLFVCVVHWLLVCLFVGLCVCLCVLYVCVRAFFGVVVSLFV